MARGVTTMLAPKLCRLAFVCPVMDWVMEMSATTVPTPMSRPATRNAARPLRRRRLLRATVSRVTEAPQSARSATVGSMRLARSAGYSEATAPMRTARPTAPPARAGAHVTVTPSPASSGSRA